MVGGRTKCVLPLDDSLKDRLALGVRPSSTDGRTRFSYYPGAVRIPETSAPNVKGRSHTIEIYARLTEDDEGVLVSAGGRFGGYVLYVRGGRMHYVHNVCGLEYHSIVSEKLPAKATSFRFEFDTDEPRLGSGGTVLLLADGVEIGSGHIDRTVPFRYSFGETFDVGRDSGTPVAESYECPFPFTGRLKRVDVELRSELPHDQRSRQSAVTAQIEENTQ